MSINVRVSDEVHTRLIAHLPRKIKIGSWVDEAIIEKICRENPDGKECNEPLKDTRNGK